MKKILALVLALCMLTACALAAGSKKSGTGTVTTETEETAEVAVTLEDVSEELLNEFAAVEAPILAFSDETKAAVDTLIGGDSLALDLIELKGIAIEGEFEGDIEMVLDFDEDFTQFNNIVGVIVANEEEMPYKMDVNEEGDLAFTLLFEDAEKIVADSEAFIAILAD